jgi:maltokinase
VGRLEEVVHARVLDAALLRSQPPVFAAAIAEIRFSPGTHQLYQLLLGYRPQEDGWENDVVGRADGQTVYDALSDPALARELVHLMRSGVAVQADEGSITFGAVDLTAFEVDLYEPRPIGVEQSNTSVVFGEELILKVFRRLEPGVNPELELLRFLSERDFPHIAPLAGWYEYAGRLVDATLGTLQEYLPGARDGWALCLDDPEGFIPRTRDLGAVTGELHTCLASDASDPDFAPEEPSTESLSLLTATVDEEIERMFVDLDPDDPALGPLAGRGLDVRERLQALSHIGAGGRVIRTHGDYHLGQTMLAERGWVVIDFEGEPARALPERRRKRSPLRDVAGMMRSFAYAASASEILRGVVPPEDWEQRARDEFLDAYLDATDPSLLPPSRHGVEQLLSVFELEKAVYELRYEMNNRPDWVRIPVAGILRLLEVPAR